MDQLTIDFAVYEGKKELMGIAKATLPDLSAITQSISGAGIAGNVDAVAVGHFDAMTLGLEFRATTAGIYKLAEPRKHTLELRIAQQKEDVALDSTGIKHIFVVIPKSTKMGSVAPASPTDGSGEYAVRYWKTTVDGNVVQEIDCINGKCIINGKDYLKSARKALGKNY